jgi:hypothetical protein
MGFIEFALGVQEAELTPGRKSLEPFLGQFVAVRQMLSPEYEFDDLVLVAAERHAGEKLIGCLAVLSFAFGVAEIEDLFVYPV